jgi:hypothetical protein
MLQNVTVMIFLANFACKLPTEKLIHKLYSVYEFCDNKKLFFSSGREAYDGRVLESGRT